jgi:hypothetical protein
MPILAALAAAGCLILFFVVLWQTLRMSERLTDFSKGGGFAFISAPTRVYLVRKDRLKWQRPDAVEAKVAEIRQLGFQDVGQFEDEEWDRQMCALVHPTDGVTATVGENRVRAVWVEMTTFFEDGTEFILVTGGKARMQPPYITVTIIKRASPRALFRRMLSERPQKPMKPDTPSDFAERFEARHARKMDWRNAHCFSEDDIRKLCRNLGHLLSDDLIQDGMRRMNRFATQSLQISLCSRYLEGAGLSEEERNHLSPRLVAVHDRLEHEMLRRLFDEADLDPGGSAAAVFQPRMPRQAFAALNQSLLGRKFEFRGVVNTPIDADIYCRPFPDSSAWG